MNQVKVLGNLPLLSFSKNLFVAFCFVLNDKNGKEIPTE